MADPERFKVPYKIEMNFHVGANHVMTFADPNAIAEIFKDVFQVSFALFLDEATYFSDIVLPAASYLERLSHTADWMSSNSPVGEWCYHVRQPVVETIAERRSVCEVILDLAERLEMREEFYALINVMLNLKEPHQIDPSRRFTWEEIVDRRYKSLFGENRGLEWFKEHGVLKWPKKVEEVYWKPFSHARVPIYFEWFKTLGEQVEAMAQKSGIELDTSAFQPLPEWRPCRSHRENSDGFDLYAIYYKFPMQTFSGTYDNPWLDEVCNIERFAYGVAINAETARRKGIEEGDWMEITSVSTGNTVRGRAAVTEGIHPEVIAIAGCGGHWSKFLSVASQEGKGLCFEWLMPVGLDNVDIPSLTQDLCVKVKVAKAGAAS
jgi:molybdopterin-containing oxidoreductase family molybdopterin binding subunit